ncbi:MAG: class I SAM-dependent methyltransferase [Bacteroidota bacterium]
MNATTNEIQAAKAFTRQSVLFDDIYSNDAIIQYKRERVRQHVKKFLAPGAHILELNAGTGEDAIFFAEQGYTVHATDISGGMLDKLSQKVTAKELDHKVTHELCSYTSLDNLIEKGPYDQLFSNFAGLNCTDQLDKVLSSLSPLIKTGGVVTLVILPKFCLWEFLLIGKGKVRTALRRFTGKKGTVAHVQGEYFTCWYYNPSYVIQHMKNDFTLLALEGLCAIVPPSYMTHFAEKHPQVFRFLRRLENRLRSRWPWRSIGDYYIISFRRK